MLRVKRDERGRPTKELEVARTPLSEAEAAERWRKEHLEYSPSDSKKSPTSGTLVESHTESPAERAARSELRSAGIICKNCDRPIDIRNPKFCPNCGAPVSGNMKGVRTASIVKVRARKQKIIQSPEISKCVVCKEELSRSDDVVFCPHCYGLAHRNHLIKWLHDRGQCPSCGKDLKRASYE